jgi:DNA replication protein DnaC
MDQMARLTSEKNRHRPIDDERLIDLGIPRRVRRSLSSTLDDTTAINAVDTWIDMPSDEETILMLFGSKGTGKTVAAGYWLMQASRRPINRVRCWYTAIELMRIGLYGSGIEEIKRRPLLVIDDLGNEFHDAKGAFDVLLYDLLNHRYDEELRTIVTGNMHWDCRDNNRPGFCQRYDHRLADRMVECGKVIICAGESLRQRIKAES